MIAALPAMNEDASVLKYGLPGPDAGISHGRRPAAGCRSYAALTSTISPSELGAGTGTPSSFRPAMWSSMVSQISLSTSARVSRTATPWKIRHVGSQLVAPRPL